MDNMDKKKFEARANFIKAMAHPSRLIMLEELNSGERCVCELREVVGSDMSTVSKHLSVLKNAGLVNVDKRGLQVYYSLRMPCIKQFTDCVDEAIRRRSGNDYTVCC